MYKNNGVVTSVWMYSNVPSSFLFLSPLRKICDYCVGRMLMLWFFFLN